MSVGDVYIVRTGTANVASVIAALRRLGASPRFVESASDMEDAGRLVLPGVGTLAAAMRSLAEQGLVEALTERFEAGRPTLAVCLGMQMLCEGSEESPDSVGLCVVPGRTVRFPSDVRVPQLGWNRIEVKAEAEVKALKGGYAYFANSYRLVEVPEGWGYATADYAGEFVAALERGSVVACQFHPELSGEFGLSIIKRWLESGGETC